MNPQNNSKRNSIILIVILLVVAGLLAMHKKTEAPVVENDWQTGPLNDLVGFHPCGNDPGANDCLSPADYDSVLGKKDDLLGFSILPGTEVSGIKSYRGMIKGGYFFEANIRVNVLDANKNIIKEGHGTATTDWMTSDPVKFEGNIDFTNLAKGPAFIEIHNDNPSDLPENDKSILIPIVIVGTSSQTNVGETYIYKNHGITLELPKGFVVRENESEGGPALIVNLPKGVLSYYGSQASWWEQNVATSGYEYVEDRKIGTHTFKIYKYNNILFYWFKQGSVGYEFSGVDENLLKTFKFVGWN